MGWESGFVAMSAALGEPLAESVEALGSEGAVQAADLVRGLKSRSRASRATALAAVLAALAADLDRMGLE
jgi:hypothetical protein